MFFLIASLALVSNAIAANREKLVMSSAYNSTQRQTDSQPNIGAWGDKIEPGMQIVAVSPDLMKLGLKRGTKIHIEGKDGEWIVLDRTPRRYRNHIDIYMGINIRAARKWGRRRVKIYWSD